MREAVYYDERNFEKVMMSFAMDLSDNKSKLYKVQLYENHFGYMFCLSGDDCQWWTCDCKLKRINYSELEKLAEMLNSKFMHIGPWTEKFARPSLLESIEQIKGLHDKIKKKEQKQTALLEKDEDEKEIILLTDEIKTVYSLSDIADWYLEIEKVIEKV